MFFLSFDMLMSKINFKKIKKYIILIYFRTKNTLKTTTNNTKMSL